MGIFNTGRLTADPYIFFYRFYSKRYCDYDFGCLYRPFLKKADRKNFKLICFLYNKRGCRISLRQKINFCHFPVQEWDPVYGRNETFAIFRCKHGSLFIPGIQDSVDPKCRIIIPQRIQILKKPEFFGIGSFLHVRVKNRYQPIVSFCFLEN